MNYPDDFHAESFATGMVVGANKGYQRGLEEGRQIGQEEGQKAGYDKGYGDGQAAGYEAGETAGEAAGYGKGYSAGEAAGEATGYQAGYAAGYAQGKTDGDAEGYQRGYSAGSAVADAEYQRGYQEGYAAGQAAGGGGGDDEPLGPTDDGATELWIDIKADALRDVELNFRTSTKRGTVTIYWGDGESSIHEQSSIFSTATNIRAQHTYPTCGKYVIRITNSISLTFGYSVSSGTQTAQRTLFGGSQSAGTSCGVVLEKAVIGSKIALNVSAFENCYNLKEVYIPDGVELSNGRIFANCYSMKTIRLPDDLTDISSNCFYACHALRGIQIPPTVKTIGTSAFAYCRTLNIVSFPGIQSIGSNALQYCYALLSVTIPETIQSINANAMANSVNIREIHIKAATPPTLSGDLSIASNDYKIYIPAGSLEEYSTAEYWSNLADKFVEE